MPSFDVVSRTDLAEVDNALNGVEREIKQRFDLANTKCAVVRSDDTLTMTADDNMKMEQVKELLRRYLAQRKVELGALEFGEPQDAAGGSLRAVVNIKQGIDGDLGRKISKEVKSAKMKVQLSIQGNELRVSGKKRDDLQAVIAFIKDMKNKQPLQFVNFRD
ncbi:MAG: YajQ family cyclic di-GMP-binding protein [SAR202 cluster bacterium]|nr:YajQ family cyclic di-GMP-binding protein [Chloroflexota bacterium]MBS32912.1 YajQ family cyclic di-GMP-binding protein [Verrucomicrobiales bacterium]MQG32768.1 YajQ family cyclic di-GMP-binding protein [SAR202 cluster bacterium]HCL25996.1 YajQ family cyclic di-GMP-binding protein [Dehalococcoidia bacterium]HCP22548.1 YajQ family cyclic di-GMP-binding protein [Dehalococcoidia bacterium]|tara:strand:- start:1780 stop:2265 length:486 start_codon:yes stop_codon:yes gene_type:complete